MALYRIALFTDSYLPSPTGVAASVQVLGEALRRKGHTVRIIAPRFPGRPPDGTDLVGVRSLPMPSFPAFRIAVPARVCLPDDLDIIHTHTPLTLGLRGTLSARRLGVPLVSTFHTDCEAYAHYVPGLRLIDAPARITARFVRWFYRQPDALVAPSEHARSILKSYDLMQPVHVIRTPANHASLDTAPAVRSPWPPNSFRLLTVGRAGIEKHQEELIDVMAAAPQDLNPHLVAIGDGPRLNYLRRLVSDAHLEQRVSFLPYVPHAVIGAYYRLAQVFVFAGTAEIQPIVLEEAASAELPIVATGVGGAAETVQHGITGYLVPPGDVETFVQRLTELAGDEQLRQRLGRTGRQQTLRSTADDMAEATLAAYGDAIRVARRKRVTVARV